MKRFVKEARLVLIWNDGHRVDMGTLTVSADEKEAHVKGMRRIRQRMGWELIRTGFRIMLPGREWRTDVDTE